MHVCMYHMYIYTDTTGKPTALQSRLFNCAHGLVACMRPRSRIRVCGNLQANGLEIGFLCRLFAIHLYSTIHYVHIFVLISIHISYTFCGAQRATPCRTQLTRRKHLLQCIRDRGARKGQSSKEECACTMFARTASPQTVCTHPHTLAHTNT